MGGWDSDAPRGERGTQRRRGCRNPQREREHVTGDAHKAARQFGGGPFHFRSCSVTGQHETAIRASFGEPTAQSIVGDPGSSCARKFPQNSQSLRNSTSFETDHVDLTTLQPESPGRRIIVRGPVQARDPGADQNCDGGQTQAEDRVLTAFSVAVRRQRTTHGTAPPTPTPEVDPPGRRVRTDEMGKTQIRPTGPETARSIG